MAFPHHSFFIDSSPAHLYQTLKLCLQTGDQDRQEVTSDLDGLWMTPGDPRPVLPCLSVRSGLDLYLQTQAYPEGSEVIITAINIQDMVQVIQHSKVKVVPVDISIDSLGLSRKDLESLVTPRTVAILVAHLFGRWVDMAPVFAVADAYNLHVLEDCAEGFCGFSHTGHPRSHISLFSFGVIKFSTSFGGAIAKVRGHDLWSKMRSLQREYPMQTNRAYLKKVLKYLLLYALMYTWPIPHASQAAFRTGFDPKEIFVRNIRSFPQGALIRNIRQQPSPALLSAMLHRAVTFDPQLFDDNRKKGNYFLSCLTPGMCAVGTRVERNNHWLFPVLVNNPEECVRYLNRRGVAAYRGSTQLSLVQTEHDQDGGTGTSCCVCGRHPGYSCSRMDVNVNSMGTRTLSFPVSVKMEDRGGSVDHNVMGGNVKHHPSYDCVWNFPGHSHSLPQAKYLMDHVIYLPVNKRVPFRDLDKMAAVCAKVAAGKDNVIEERVALLQFDVGGGGGCETGRGDVRPKSRL